MYIDDAEDSTYTRVKLVSKKPIKLLKNSIESLVVNGLDFD